MKSMTRSNETRHLKQMLGQDDRILTTFAFVAVGIATLRPRLADT